MPVIQVVLTAEELAELVGKADAAGSTVSQYIKDIVLPDNEFRRWFPELLRRVDLMAVGTEFNIRAVMGINWVNIPKGIRLALGRVFYQHVSAGRVASVRATQADSAKTQWYIKE